MKEYEDLSKKVDVVIKNAVEYLGTNNSRNHNDGYILTQITSLFDGVDEREKGEFI